MTREAVLVQDQGAGSPWASKGSPGPQPALGPDVCLLASPHLPYTPWPERSGASSPRRLPGGQGPEQAGLRRQEARAEASGSKRETPVATSSRAWAAAGKGQVSPAAHAPPAGWLLEAGRRFGGMESLEMSGSF